MLQSHVSNVVLLMLMLAVQSAVGQLAVSVQGVYNQDTDSSLVRQIMWATEAQPAEERMPFFLSS